MDKIMALMLFCLVISFLSLLVVIYDATLCVPFEGLDHNGNNDPFSGYVGWCR